MRQIFLVLAVIIQGSLHCLAAAGHKELWQKGNSFYQDKQYDSAAVYYEKIAAAKPRNADIYYNLGNAYYRLNKVGMAVLNYERALKINPDHKTAKDNLVLAQGRISNHIHTAGDIFFVRWWDTITKPGSAAAWAISALITFTLLMLLLLLKRLNRTTGSRIPVQLNGILIVIFICCLGLAFAASKNSVQHTAAVVMENDAPLMNADLKGKPIMLVPEGTTVKIRSQNGDWIEVSIPDGRTGWLRQNIIAKI